MENSEILTNIGLIKLISYISFMYYVFFFMKLIMFIFK